MVEHGAAADVGFTPRLVGGGKNSAAIDVEVQPHTLGNPLPGLAVVQRRGPARQLHCGHEYVVIYQRVRHDRPPVSAPRVRALSSRPNCSNTPSCCSVMVLTIDIVALMRV